MTCNSFRYPVCLFILFALATTSTQAQKKKPQSDGLFKMLWMASHFTIDEAEEYYKQEVKQILADQALYKPRKFPIALAQRYTFLNSIYYKKGDFRQADRYFSKIDSLAKIHKSVVTLKSAALNERSRLMIEIGDHTEAKEIIQTNIHEFESLKDQRMIMCDAYSTYATYYKSLGQYDSSVFYFKKYILQMHNNWFLPFVNEMANSYTQLAEVAAKNNELKDGLKYAKKGYRVNSHRWARKNNKANNYYDRIVSANTVAEVYRLSGQNKKALRWNSLALRLYSDRPTKIAQFELPILTTRALTHWSQHNMTEAQSNFDRITTTYFNHVNNNFSYLSEFERVYFYNHTKHHIEYAKAFYFEQIQSGIPGADQKLFELSINTKGLLFNSSLKFIDKVTLSQDTSISNGYNRLKDIKSQISTLSLSHEPGSTTNALQQLDQQSKALEKTLMDKLGIEKERFITYTEVLKQIPDQHQLVDIVKCQLPQALRSASQQGSVISLSDSSAYVYFVSNPSRQAFTVDFTRKGKQLEGSMYKAYRNAVRFNITEPRLYEEYFSKIKNLLSSNQVLYSADGIYNLINPNVLFDGAQYMIDQFDFNCLVTSKEILQQRMKNISVTSISFFGRPDFSGHATNEYSGYADLPGTEQEIKSIQAIIPNHVSNQTFLGTQANENQVKAINATTVLHFATHGYFNESSYRNPLLNSGLVLSKEISTNNEDGLLTAYEASTLNLSNTSLVILSACETGLGTTVDGDGVWGLQRAFQSAGVNYIIMSLFKVDDAITAQLMTRFYEYLMTGQPIYEAFKNAEKKIKEEYPQPIHWGSFILKGY